MPLAGHKPPMDEEATLAARAAWLYFAGGQTQGEVAEELNVASTKAHRLIAKASRDGLIRVFVEGPMAGCVALEDELKRRFGLTHCEVVPNIDDGPLPLRTLGTAGARYLRHRARPRPGCADRRRPWPHARRLDRLPAEHAMPGGEIRLAARRADAPLRRQPVRRHPSPCRKHRRRSLSAAGSVLRQQHRGQEGAARASSASAMCWRWRDRPRC